MLDIVNSRVFNIYSEDGIADALPTNKVARLEVLYITKTVCPKKMRFLFEVVPPDEMVLGDDELLVAVAHFHKVSVCTIQKSVSNSFFSKETFQTFGAPFCMRVKDVII